MPDVLGLLMLFAVAGGVVVVAGTWALFHALRYPPRRTFGEAVGRGMATEPAELGLDGEEVTFTFADGAESPGWVMRGEREGGPTVVVVHGFADSRFGALAWARRVAKHASRVVVYDLRGHGDSTARGATCGLKDVDDLERVVAEATTGDQGGGGRLERVVLLGYSMGAGIAIAAAAAAGEAALRGGRPRVVGVIAEGPYRWWDEPIKAHLRSRGYAAQPFTGLAGILLRLFVPGFGGFDRAGWAAKLPCPILVLHGSDDPLCPMASAEAIAAAAKRGRLVVIEGAKHLDLAEVDGTGYEAALAAFFEEVRDESGKSD